MNELDFFEGSDQPLFELALFAGAGGGILGGKLLSWQTVAAVEWEAYPGAVLSARQDDELLAPFPIWSDVQSFTKRNNACRRFIRSLRAIRHQLVISGGFPCQDISAAGKGEGIDGERSGMWGHVARIIGEIRPRFVFVENSPMLVGRGLAQMGYDASWCIVGAADCGAPHKRDRIWILASDCRETLADADSERLVAGGFRGRHEAELPEADDDCGSCEQGIASDSSSEGLEGLGADTRQSQESKSRDDSSQPPHAMCVGCGQVESEDSPGAQAGWSASEAWQRSFDGRGESWWATEPDVGRVAHGVAARVDRLKAIGNGQVPFAAATAWKILTERGGVES